MITNSPGAAGTTAFAAGSTVEATVGAVGADGADA